MGMELKWGLLFSLSTLVWALIEKLGGFHDARLEQHPWFSMLFMIPAVAIYYFAVRNKRASQGGTIDFKQIFMFGLAVSVIVAVLSPLLQWVTHRVISPNYFANIIQLSVSTGRMTQQQAEAFFNLNSYIIQSSIFALVAGVVTTLVLAALMQTRGAQKPSGGAPQG
ncbi:MAG: DUF4199 domain-containing protein [Blastocatellia bacterium]|nr:DUF4199 domain-containing protein [Blastocatellia bacterium]